MVDVVATPAMSTRSKRRLSLMVICNNVIWLICGYVWTWTFELVLWIYMQIHSISVMRSWMIVVMCGCKFGSSPKFIWLIVMLQSYMQGYVVWHIIRSALQKFEASIVCEKYNIVYKMRGKKYKHIPKIFGTKQICVSKWLKTSKYRAQM
jgi:hypothetical protein